MFYRASGLACHLGFSGDCFATPIKVALFSTTSERSDLSTIRAIEQNLREVFYASAPREIDSFSEYCGCACVPLRFCIIYFPVLCQ